MNAMLAEVILKIHANGDVEITFYGVLLLLLFALAISRPWGR